MVKSFLKLAREFQDQSYDALVAHTSMVFIRYNMLAVVNRSNQDPHTIEEFFYADCDEIPDISPSWKH